MRWIPILLALLCAPAYAHAQSFESLAPSVEATHVAAQSGVWSTASTWTGGVLPTDLSKVFIPPGLTVTINTCLTASPSWVRVEGTLRFGRRVQSCLDVESLYISMGTLIMDPQPSGSARLRFKAHSGQPIDQAYDPFELSRGLVAHHGHVEILGTPKTSWVPVTMLPTPGSTQIQVNTIPTGWLPGDELVLTSSAYNEEEKFQLVSVNNNLVTVTPAVANLRAFPAGCPAGCSLHLANLTRNIKIESDPANAGNRQLQGHVMLMHHGGHTIKYAEFANLGRTTTQPVTDPLVVNGVRDASLAPGCKLTVENVRGRYALHFHRAEPSSLLSTVDGVSVHQVKDSGFKFGIINHSSNVDVLNSVVLNVDGSQYMTEEGDERGRWMFNIAIHSKGNTNGGLDHQPPDNCMQTNHLDIFNRRRWDVGFQGAGFWPQGGGVDLVGNVAAGMFSSGIDTWTRPLDFQLTNTYEVRFPSEFLRGGPEWANGQTMIEIEFPPSLQTDSQVYAVSTLTNAQKQCYNFKYHGLNVVSTYPNAPFSVAHRLLGWNCRIGIGTTYVGHIDYKDVFVLQGTAFNANQPGSGVRLGAQGGNNNKLENVSINGYQTGLLPSVNTTYTNVTIDGVPYVP